MIVFTLLRVFGPLDDRCHFLVEGGHFATQQLVLQPQVGQHLALGFLHRDWLLRGRVLRHSQPRV